MGGVRHAFVSRDGRTYADWLKVAREVDCVSFERLSADQPTPYDLIWIHAGAAPSPGFDPLELVRNLATRTPCVVLADIPNDQDALASLAAGARGYCNSHANSRVLKLVADVVMQGGLWIGESLLHRMIAGIGVAANAGAGAAAVPGRGAAQALAVLSPRERQVAEAIAGGANNKELARLLNITERTVKAHVSTILDKMGVKDRLQLAVKIIGLRK